MEFAHDLVIPMCQWCPNQEETPGTCPCTKPAASTLLETHLKLSRPWAISKS